MTVEDARVNRLLSPPWIERLIRERNKGKSLRQLGRMFNKSHDTIRQILAKYGPSPGTLLPEAKAKYLKRYQAWKKANPEKWEEVF